MKPKEALSSPRFYTYHTEDSFNPASDPSKRFYRIGALDIFGADQQVISSLGNRGHIVTKVPGHIAAPAMIYIDQDSRIRYAATEPLYKGEDERGKYCGALDPVEQIK
jgi:hypothetical protein